jgi:hypothetical protein
MCRRTVFADADLTIGVSSDRHADGAFGRIEHDETSAILQNRALDEFAGDDELSKFGGLFLERELVSKFIAPAHTLAFRIEQARL